MTALSATVFSKRTSASAGRRNEQLTRAKEVTTASARGWLVFAAEGCSSSTSSSPNRCWPTAEVRPAHLGTAQHRKLQQAIRRRFEEIGFAAQASTPDEFTEKVRADEARWKRLIDERGLKVE